MTAELYELVEQAFKLAKGERAGELRGRRVRRFDDRGLHPYSEVWGYIGAATGEDDAGPELAEQAWQKLADKYPEVAVWLGDHDFAPALSPHNVRRAAAEQADAEFRAEIIASEWPDAD